MFYIIQENLFREYHYDKLISTLKRYGFDYHIVRSFPYVDKIVDVNDIPDEAYEVMDLPDLNLNFTQKIFVFGSVKLARITSELGWQPGSQLNDAHDFMEYKEHYKEHLLNWDSKICKLGDDLQWDGYMFLRPTNDNKAFTGAMFTNEEWVDKKEHILWNFRSDIINEDTLIQLSTPKEIQKEIRCWVVGGKVVTASQYRLGNSVILDGDVENDALKFAQSMVDIHQIASSFVIDVCLSDGVWKIVELGCINSAGFYKSDLSLLIQKLEEFYG
jgi:hypothetical protein